MNKYGVENFIVEELEYVKDENILSEREVYWIKELETYGSKGYIRQYRINISNDINPSGYAFIDFYLPD